MRFSNLFPMILGALTFFLLSIFVVPANANKLKAGVFLLPPWAEKGEGNDLVGVVPDFIQALAEEAGIEIEMSGVPYKRMLSQLQYGVVDFSIFFRSSQSEKIAKPLEKLYKIRNIVVGKIGINLSRYDDLKRHTIAVPRGVFFEKRFDNDKKLQKMVVNDYTLAAKMLVNDRVTLLAGPEMGLYYNLKKLGVEKSALGKPFELSHKEVWIQTSFKAPNGDPAAFATLARAAVKLRINGTINAIVQRYSH